MEKKVSKKAVSGKTADAPADIEFAAGEVSVPTSPRKKRAAATVKAAAKSVSAASKAAKKPVKKTAKKATLDVTAEIAATEPKVEVSAAFKSLAEPTLPELGRENRARLLMQSPTRLYFYWSVREDPYHLLRDVFGDDIGSYTLVLKLKNARRGTEEIHRAEAEGNWWFSVEPDGEYQAEIGFYAPNRPYFRIIYSNTVETPRRSPSRNSAAEAKWTVTANKFAEVLDVAGFSQDAFDVAMAGDDHAAAENATHIAFSRFIGTSEYALDEIAAEDIRFAMTSLAAGHLLEQLRTRVSPALFAILQANAEKLGADKALAALTEYFDIDEAEFVQEQLGSAVFGASLVHFPRSLKTRTLSPKFAPVSSHSLR